MSSTKRGASKDAGLDVKYTDDRVALALVKSLHPRVFAGSILEPSVGGGAFVRAVRLARGDHRADVIFGVDIDSAAPGLPEADVPVVGNFLDACLFEEMMEGAPSLVIGNPPFSGAEDHIRRAMEVVLPFGTVAFILRLNFLGTIKRRDLWKEYPPTRVDVIRPRPSFTGGGTDSCEYAFFQWVSGARNSEMRLGFVDWER